MAPFKIIIHKYYHILFILFLFNCSPSSPNYNKESRLFQKELKENYNNFETTPLHLDERQDFKGITFFPIDLKYVIEAHFSPSESDTILDFSTSANKIKRYKEYGVLNFKIDGTPYDLTVYQSFPIQAKHTNHLFIPFNDLTNGINSYGGGRYIDLQTTDIQNGKVMLNFNKAYNPYCAYSKYYNCPIPPENNFLNTEIKAGVSFKENH